MSNIKSLELGMVDGTKVYVKGESLEDLGVPIRPDSYIGNYIRGSRGPLLPVYADDTFSQPAFFVNPALIVSMKIITE